MIHTFDSQYTNYTVNYFVVDEYSRENHFPQSDCDSIERQIEFVKFVINKLYYNEVRRDVFASNMTFTLSCSEKYNS